MIQLKRSTPEEQGVDSAGILELLKSLESDDIKSELHSFMMIRHGHVIAEGWAKPYDAKKNHHLYSLSKSFTSTAIGLAISEGLLSEDDYIKDIFSDYLEEPYEANMELLQVKHLLSMAGGQESDIFTTGIIETTKDWMRVYLDTPIIHKPGTVFEYNTGSTYVLSVIVEKVSGLTLEEYLSSRLFKPLGFSDTRWATCPLKHNLGGTGLYLRTEDIGKFGLCYLNEGEFDGKQVIPKEWVAKATSKIIDNSNGEDPHDWNQGYGYKFWQCLHNAYRADGAFGQFCICLPEQDVVIVMTSGYGEMATEISKVWEHILPAIDNVKEDCEEQGNLVTYLENMEAPYPKGEVEHRDIEEKRYVLDEHYYSFDRIGFALKGNKGAFKLFSKKSRILIPFGTDHYEEGKFTLNRSREIIESRGTWTGENEFTIFIRYINTPHFEVLKLLFDGVRIKVTMDRNIGFDEPKQIVIRGELNQYSR